MAETNNNIEFGDSDKHELGDVIRANIQYYLRHQFNTGIFAQITGIEDYQEKQVINVTPIINQTYKDGVVLELPEITDVPVILPSAGRGLLSFPVRVDDVVWLAFAQRTIQEFKLDEDNLGTEADGLPFTRFTPGTRALGDFNDAVAFLGGDTMTSNLKPNPNDVELKFANSYIRIQPDGTIWISSDKDVIVDVEANLTATVKGDTVLTGSGKLDLDITGNILVKSAAEIELQAPSIKLTGAVTGSSSASFSGALDGGTVKATIANVTLELHEHTANNTPPTPGT